MSETITNIIEGTELVDKECITKRIANIGKFENGYLGPPDLCYLIKMKNPTGALSSMLLGDNYSQRGYFHYILGFKITGLEDFKHYLLSLLDAQEELSFFNRLFPSTEYQFISFHYCTYNSFRSVDIHFCIRESKKITKTDINSNNIIFDCYTIDSNGKKIDIIEYDESIWKEIFVSSMLRYLSKELNIETLYKKINPLKIYDGYLKNKHDEILFIDYCKQLFSNSLNLGCQLLISRPTLHNNFMTKILLKYFKDSKRLGDAIMFFKECNLNFEDIESIFLEINRYKSDINTTDVNYSTQSLDLLISLAKSCLSIKRYEEAFEFSKQAYITYNEDWRSIYIYSLCNIYLGRCDESIKVILDYPIVQMPSTLDSYGISKPSSLIIPYSINYNTTYIIEREIIEENSDYNLILNINHTKIEKQIYKLLYLIYQKIGLEQLLVLATSNLKDREELDMHYVQYLKKANLNESRSSSDFEELDESIITFDIENKTSEIVFKSTTLRLFKQVLNRLIDNIQLYENMKLKSSLSNEEKLQLAILCKNLFNLGEAKKYYDNLLETGWSFMGCRDCALIYLEEGNIEKSFEYLNRMMNFLISKHNQELNPDIITRLGLISIIKKHGYDQVHQMFNLIFKGKKVNHSLQKLLTLATEW